MAKRRKLSSQLVLLVFVAVILIAPLVLALSYLSRLSKKVADKPSSTASSPADMDQRPPLSADDANAGGFVLDGNVARAMELTVEDLRRFDQSTRTYELKLTDDAANTMTFEGVDYLLLERTVSPDEDVAWIQILFPNNRNRYIAIADFEKMEPFVALRESGKNVSQTRGYPFLLILKDDSVLTIYNKVQGIRYLREKEDEK